MDNKKEIFNILNEKLNKIDSLLLKQAEVDAKTNKQFKGKFLNLIIKS